MFEKINIWTAERLFPAIMCTDLFRFIFTLTTVDIIGADGTSFLAGTGTNNFQETNVAGSGAFAVNTDTDQDGGLANDATAFNQGEGWLFSIDEDVNLQSITFANFNDDDAVANFVVG